VAIYRFGAFELDAARGELHRAGKPVPAERRAVELLLHLLRNRDRVVSKEELLAGLWPGVAVQDRVVNQAIYNARKLLGDDTRAPRFIATLRGRGFRCVAEVEEAASPRALPFTIALRSLQREIIRCDPGWNGGDYFGEEGPDCGMVLARKLGLMSYRAAAEWRHRFNRARMPPERRPQGPFAIEFEIESYLDYNARKFVRTFDANSYLCLSRAMDWFDVADHGGSVNAGLARIHTRRSLIVGVTGDILFPLEQQKEIAAGLEKAGREVEFVELGSIYGHDSFLIDEERFAPVVRRFLDEAAREQAADAR